MAANMTDPAAAQAALQAELATLLTASADYRLTREFWMGSMVVLLYDYSLTFSDEVVYLKRGRFSFMKGVFLINRYWPMFRVVFDNIVLALPHPSIHSCFVWVNSFAYSAIPIHFSISTILIMRIYVMYACNKILLAVLCTLFSIELITETIIIGISTSKEFIQPLPPLPNFTGCVPVNTVSYQWAYWLPTLLFELTLFSLAVFKSFQVYRARKSAGETPNILVILFRDSVLYFGGVMVVIITNLITWAVAPQGLYSTFVNTAYAAHSILGCRMMLNIQEAAAKPRYPQQETTIGPSKYYTARAARTGAYEADTEMYQMKPMAIRSGGAPMRIDVETTTHSFSSP